ncbi:hypothetical protein RUND412_005578 [Rhizina undulata]
MDTLPAEILQEIVSYLFGSDLNSLRLVNRSLSAAASIFKFRALYVRVTRRGLENLLNVSRQPGLARCVREITYPHGRLNPRKLPPFGDIDVRFRRRSVLPEKERLEKMFYNWYNENYTAQIELEESGECVRALETAFSRMPNIRTIIPGHNSIFNYRSDFEKWCRTLTETDKTYARKWPYQLSMWRNISELLVKESEEQAMKAVMELVNTSHRLGFKLDRFGRCGSGVWCGIFSKGSDLWNCASLFQNLTSVFVCITTMYTWEDAGALKVDVREGRIYKFLSFAPNLRTLSLEIINHSAYPIAGLNRVQSPWIPRLLDILGHDYVWKYLHTFYLDFLPIHLEDLVEFLGRHAMTLKCLRLGCDVLLDGTWREALDFLKERLHLTDLQLYYTREIRGDGGYGVYNIDAKLKMEDYVLRGGTPFPPTQMELDENGWDMEDYWSDDHSQDGDWSDDSYDDDDWGY